MRWLLLSPKDRRRAAGWCSTGVGALLVAGLAGSLAIAPGPVFWGPVGFVAFVLCTGRALELWRVDRIVFDHRRPWNSDEPATTAVFQDARQPGRARQLRHV